MLNRIFSRLNFNLKRNTHKMQTRRILRKIERKIVWADAGIWAGRGEIQASRAPNDFSRCCHINGKKIMTVAIQIKILCRSVIFSV